MNVEHKRSDRLTVAKLNNVSKSNKQDYKSKLLTEKYSPLPTNSQQLTPAQTALQRQSEKHPDFEIQPVNTIRPQILNTKEVPNHWYQLMCHYQLLENTFLNSLILIKL